MRRERDEYDIDDDLRRRDLNAITDQRLALAYGKGNDPGALAGLFDYRGGRDEEYNEKLDGDND